jgi:hypothetical protein
MKSAKDETDNAEEATATRAEDAAEDETSKGDAG